MSDDSSCSNSTKKAVVLLNMGGPSNLGEVEVFLKNMFADRRILTVKSDLVRAMIRFFIVTFRTSKAQGHYRLIGGRSPLLEISRRLADKLSALTSTPVFLAMRYTQPFAQETIAQLKDHGIEKVVLLPMYPHYSTTTSLSSVEDFISKAKALGFTGKIEQVASFFDNRLFNRVIVERITQALNGEDADDYELVFSAHGLPQKIVDAGDPYQNEVEEHVELLEQLLFAEGLKFRKVHLAYQSKVGPMKWIEPSLDSVLEKMKNKRVLIYPIAFTIDNLETNYELSIEYKEKFGDKFESYRVAECPNDSDAFVAALADMIESAPRVNFEEERR